MAMDLAGWSEGGQLFAGYLLVLAVVAAYHQLIAKGKPGDWFEAHAVANAITVIFCLPSMLLWLQDPIAIVLENEYAPPPVLGTNWTSIGTLFHPNNQWAILTIDAIHTYHCLAFDLSGQDIFHHFLFVPIIGIFGAFYIGLGPIRNVVCFFISGLPGGIDYVCLVLVKRGKLSKFFQKRLSSKINLLIRGPGIGVLLPATCYLGILYSKDVTWGFIAKTGFVAAFCAYNGLYYMEMAIKNYQMHLTKGSMRKEHMKEMAKIRDEAAAKIIDYWAEKETQSKKIQLEPGVKGWAAVRRTFTGGEPKSASLGDLRKVE